MIKTRSCWKFGGPAERKEPRLFNFVYDRSGPWFRLYAPTGSAPVLFYPESPWTWSGAGASRTRKRTGMRTPSTCPVYKPRSAVIVNRRRPLSSGCHNRYRLTINARCAIPLAHFPRFITSILQITVRADNWPRFFREVMTVLSGRGRDEKIRGRLSFSISRLDIPNNFIATPSSFNGIRV